MLVQICKLLDEVRILCGLFVFSCHLIHDALELLRYEGTAVFTEKTLVVRHVECVYFFVYEIGHNLASCFCL